MKTKRRIGVITVLLAILVALVLFVKLWSQSFYNFAHLDRATQLYIHSARNIKEAIPQATLEKQEFQPLVDVLGCATVRFDGRSRLLKWDMEDNMYDLYFRHFENDEPVLDADVSLCSDGMMYVHLGEWFGYIRYRLEDCDMDAVAAVLDELLVIDQEDATPEDAPLNNDNPDGNISDTEKEELPEIVLEPEDDEFVRVLNHVPDCYIDLRYATANNSRTSALLIVGFFFRKRSI